MIKVQWQRHNAEESTWESEEVMKVNYPQFFNSTGNPYLLI